MRFSLNKFKKILKNIIPNRYLLYSGPMRDRTISLTFDDGPHSENTEKILAILESQNVKATFFLLGSEIIKHTNLVKKIAEDGHQIGSHSFYHKRIKDLGFAKYIEGMRKTERLIFEVTKRKCKFFRPPWGELDIRLLIYALKNKITIVNWSFDSTDSYKYSPIDLKQYLKSAVIKAGEIILFHEDYKHTPEALSDIIIDLKLREFTFSTISGLLERC